MRIASLAASILAITVTAAAAAELEVAPRAVYRSPPVETVVVSEAINPAYVVNQGPVLSGPGIYSYTNVLYYPSYARPTYLEGAYGYTDGLYYRWSDPYYPYAYPYVRGPFGWRCGWRYPCISGYHPAAAPYYWRRPYPYTAARYYWHRRY